VNRRPFDTHANQQSEGKHHEVTTPPRIHEPIASAERHPAGAEDEEDKQPIAQARNEDRIGRVTGWVSSLRALPWTRNASRFYFGPVEANLPWQA